MTIDYYHKMNNKENKNIITIAWVILTYINCLVGLLTFYLIINEFK